MRLAVDSAGRLTLPPEMRSALGVPSQGEVEAVRTNQGVELKPVEWRASVAEVNGVLVWTGPAEPIDAADAVARARDERTRGIESAGRHEDPA